MDSNIEAAAAVLWHFVHGAAGGTFAEQSEVTREYYIEAARAVVSAAENPWSGRLLSTFRAPP
jgi:hypothetical protein